MKYAIIILAAMAMASCGDATPDANDTELEVAAAAGRAMGEHAAALPENSMEQQNAVLDIRARENIELALQNYHGAILVATHDETFAENVGFEQTIPL